MRLQVNFKCHDCESWNEKNPWARYQKDPDFGTLDQAFEHLKEHCYHHMKAYVEIGKRELTEKEESDLASILNPNQ